MVILTVCVKLLTCGHHIPKTWQLQLWSGLRSSHAPVVCGEIIPISFSRHVIKISVYSWYRERCQITPTEIQKTGRFWIHRSSITQFLVSFKTTGAKICLLALKMYVSLLETTWYERDIKVWKKHGFFQSLLSLNESGQFVPLFPFLLCSKCS